MSYELWSLSGFFRLLTGLGERCVVGDLSRFLLSIIAKG